MIQQLFGYADLVQMLQILKIAIPPTRRNVGPTPTTPKPTNQKPMLSSKGTKRICNTSSTAPQPETAVKQRATLLLFVYIEFIRNEVQVILTAHNSIMVRILLSLNETISPSKQCTSSVCGPSS